MSRYRRDLFPVSIFHGSVDQNNDLKKILMPLINRTKNHDEVLEPPSGWSTNNLKTSFSSEKVNKYVFGNGDNEIENKIKSQYIKTLDGFFDKNWQIDLSEIWFNYYENGEWQEAHRHISSGLGQATHFACVHFLSFDPENHMPLRLLDPLSLHRALGFEFDSVKVSEKIDLITREGDLVMFPSWLEHEVLPGKSTPGNPRITVAFNVTVESYGDEQDGDDDE
jgi:hypothetical protein